MNAFLNLSGRRRLPLFRQAEGAECGLACIAMVAGFHGHDVDLTTLRRKFSLSSKGMTMRTMVQIAAGLQLSARAVRCEVAEVSSLRLPAILHWGTNHFVVLSRVTKNGIIIHDPAHGVIPVNWSLVSTLFTGVALELSPNGNFQKIRERNSLSLGSLISFRGSVNKAMLQVLTLSLLMETLVLTSPFYLQSVIDEVIVSNDLDLLTVLAIIFTTIALFGAICSFMRGITGQFISNTIAFDMKGKIFNHLVRLPLDWFQKRHIGDIQSRFWSVRAVQAFVSQGALTALIDSGVSIVVIVLMFVYAPILASTVILSVIFCGLARAGSFQISKIYAADAIVTDAKEQTKLLETLRAAQTIKAAGAESIRDTQYRNAAAASINSQIRSGNVSFAYQSIERLVLALADVAIIYLGARYVVSGKMSVGMLTAFLAYKIQFVGRSANIIEQFFSWRLLGLQLERISDIVLTDKHSQIDNGGFDGPIEGAISCRNLGFRYAYGEKPVLQGLNITIQPGECVAIVGASGCGKSTLAKLLVGLYSPTAGQVLVDGRSIDLFANHALRSQISYVAQDDVLLAGSIADNIALFEDKVDKEWIKHCARMAFIDKEIENMPMGYESLVGDMGSSLSGGQKQRILLARSLYRNPKILILDEATSQLDVSNEKAIGMALSSLKMTRIVIAHRPETIASADRIISIERPISPYPGVGERVFENVR